MSDKDGALETGFSDSYAVEPYYDSIARIYADAFGREPWNEKSMCFAVSTRGEFSGVPVSVLCDECRQVHTTPAYPAGETIAKFRTMAQNHQSIWYLEKAANTLLLAAFSWVGSAKQIADEEYASDPEISRWLSDKFGDEPLIWLDETFANLEVRPSGNLKNFESMCRGFSQLLKGHSNKMVFRTLSPAMLHASGRFKDRAKIYAPNSQVPDWRYFIVIDF